jgi:hypothetical protein
MPPTLRWVEGMDGEPAADQIGDDIRSEIGERQDEVGLQRQNLVDVRDVKALTRGFSRRACGGRTTEPQIPTMRSCSPSR